MRLRDGPGCRAIPSKKHFKADTVEPKFAIPDRPSKFDPFTEKLAGWLKSEAGKSRKLRRTLKQLHSDLVTLGFTGSYGRVAAFAPDWRAARQQESQTTGRGTFVSLTFRPGEAFQFEWSEDYAVLGGERTKLQVAYIKLSHSRAFLVRAYLLLTHEMLFDAQWHGFRVATELGPFVLREARSGKVPTIGQSLRLMLDPGNLHLFDPKSEHRVD